MNPAAIDRYVKWGGAELIGKCLLDCHNDKSKEMIHKVVNWFKASKDNNLVYTSYNPKENKDVYMLALRDPDSLIAVVSTIRRGGAVIGFAYGLIFLKEPDPWRKVLCMVGILTGLICLAIGSL
jgi:hypothetical protein